MEWFSCLCINEYHSKIVTVWSMLLWIHLQMFQAFRGSGSEQNAALTLREHLTLQQYYVSHPRFIYLFIYCVASSTHKHETGTPKVKASVGRFSLFQQEPLRFSVRFSEWELEVFTPFKICSLVLAQVRTGVSKTSKGIN